MALHSSELCLTTNIDIDQVGAQIIKSAPSFYEICTEFYVTLTHLFALTISSYLTYVIIYKYKLQKSFLLVQSKASILKFRNPPVRVS